MATETFTTITPAEIAATFNDATRALIGGFWSQDPAVNEGNQGPGSLSRYQTDLTNIQTALQNVTNPTPQTTAILADIATALEQAPATLGPNASADAQAALRAAHLDILTQVGGDPQLAGAGFTQVGPTLDHPLKAAHATFEEIGVIFNDLLSRSLGGLTQETAPAFTREVGLVERSLKQFEHDNPDALTGLSLVHVDAIINQLKLQKVYDGHYGQDTLTGRGSNDNLLDIVDIVQGDDALLGMAGAGWSATPEALKETTPYQDNAAQTNFWAGFVASSNALGDAATQLVGSGDKAAIHELIKDLKTFQTNVEKFDASQGGIFAARFDNELLGNKSTTGAEVADMIKGLKTGDTVLVTAAADQMHANAADVASNNVPVNGGTFNTDARTIADALNMTTPPADPATPLAPTPPAVAGASNGGGAAATPPVAGADPGAATHGHIDHHDVGHHFGHMWG